MDERILVLPVLLFSLVIHEMAHAYVAFRGGDDTAALQGRLTLNPLAHIDPIGTVLIPILQFFNTTGIPLIGWAKPVPVNPLRLRSSEWDMFVSLAGPGSNLCLAVLAAALFKIIMLVGFPDLLFTPFGRFTPMGMIMFYFLSVNVALAVFNLLPVPPLDGSHVLMRLLISARSPLAERYEALAPYGMFILMVILISPAGDLLGMLIRVCRNVLFKLIV